MTLRKNQDCWYNRVKESGILSEDPLISNYQTLLNELKKNENPAVLRVNLLQTQSKLARSISLIFIIFAIVFSIGLIWVLTIFCLALFVFMLYSFYKSRWETSEIVYEAIYITKQT